MAEPEPRPASGRESRTVGRGATPAIRKMLAGLAVLAVVWLIGVIGYVLAGWRLDDACSWW